MEHLKLKTTHVAPPPDYVAMKENLGVTCRHEVNQTKHPPRRQGRSCPSMLTLPRCQGRQNHLTPITKHAPTQTAATQPNNRNAHWRCPKQNLHLRTLCLQIPRNLKLRGGGREGEKLCRMEGMKGEILQNLLSLTLKKSLSPSHLQTHTNKSPYGIGKHVSPEASETVTCGAKGQTTNRHIFQRTYSGERVAPMMSIRGGGWAKGSAAEIAWIASREERKEDNVSLHFK